MEIVFLGILILLMIVALSSGFPVAFALPGSAIGAIVLAAACGQLFAGDPSAYFAQDGPVQWLTAGVTNFRSLYWEVERDTLIAIPLFVFMGIMLQRSKIAEDLLVAMAQLFGPVPGGLGISVVFVGALLAATTGILGATVIAMGLISLPAMLRNNYSKPLATGAICASGTLGQIIPPSIVLIILADQLANAADQARTIRASQYKEVTGEFSMPPALDITSASAGDMFMGALIPGIVLVCLYMLYILVRAILKPEDAPPVPYDGKYDSQFVLSISISLVPPLALIFAVLGSIVTGVATVNQAGAIGAVGAIVMGGYRLAEGRKYRYIPLLLIALSVIAIAFLSKSFDLNIKSITSTRDFYAVIGAAVAVLICLSAVVWSAWRTFRIDNTLGSVMIDTAKTTSMVFIILLGAAMLTAAFRGFGGEHLVREFLTSLPGGFWTQFLVVMLVIFLLGFFLDFIEIAVVVVPIVAPILLADPSANVTAVWLGVMIGLNIQTSFLTPPFGFALFYLRGVAPPEVKTTHIYKGAVAFILLQLAGLGIAGYFPSLVNYMPNLTYLTSDTAPPPVNPRLQQCIENDVFQVYANNRESILAGNEKLRNSDLVLLPEKLRDPLLEGIDRISANFDLVAAVNQAENQADQFIIDYRPVQSQVFRIQTRIRNIDNRIAVTDKKIKRMKRAQADAEQIADLETTVFELEIERKILQDEIPADWEELHASYLTLQKAETAARKAYRQNADAAYAPLQNVMVLLQQKDRLAPLFNDLNDLAGLFDAEQGVAEKIEQIKRFESRVGELEGMGDVRTQLSKSRRALKGDAPDFAQARIHYQDAATLLSQEIEWRTRATALESELAQFDDLVKSNIGMRLQGRIPDDKTGDIASCLSVHRDISMHFQ